MVFISSPRPSDSRQFLISNYFWLSFAINLFILCAVIILIVLINNTCATWWNFDETIQRFPKFGHFLSGGLVELVRFFNTNNMYFPSFLFIQNITVLRYRGIISVRILQLVVIICNLNYRKTIKVLYRYLWNRFLFSKPVMRPLNSFIILLQIKIYSILLTFDNF